METYIKTYKRPNNEIQNVQVVKLDNWDCLDFYKPNFSKEALKHLADIYRDFFVKKAPLVFGTIYVFHVPENIGLPFTLKDGEDPHIKTRQYLIKNHKTKEAKEFLKKLEDEGYLYVIKGKNPFVYSFLPYESIGFLSQGKAKLKVNSSFFTFDLFDLDSDYDICGTPIGMYVKNGEILSPPLFNREALMVDKNNKVFIKQLSLNDISLSIKGRIYERPKTRNTPSSDNYDVVVIGDKVVDIRKGGKTRVPSSGFVINSQEEHFVGEKVKYSGLENIKFAIQCGNSIIVDGKKTTDFISTFYHLLKPFTVQYPPSQYPHDFNKDRAPRIALGVDSGNVPTLIWAEGASKFKHIPGEDSVGASLSEMADILQDLNIKDAINLDGGGSGQIIIEDKRYLKISDRNFRDNSESERPIPIGLIIK